ncbi:MAG: hypothetical protein ACI8S6_001578 [Myxococcota bacterium]|jgi:hypothetical protein
MLLLILSTLSLAEVPVGLYTECGEPDRPDACPSDLGEDWSFLSYVPEHARGTVRPVELEYGSGNRVDRAWRLTTGRWDAVVAVGDSGLNWAHTDLINKIRLNTAELPLPQDASGVEAASYDLNGDGIVNVQDYAEDPRVTIDSGNDVADAVLDPSDLIYTFSDSVDDDENGYIDDIAGWDFFDRDNDAYHSWDDSHGTHGNGVLREVGAEAENGGDVGVCPNCALLPLRQGDTFITDGSRVAEAILYAADAGAAGIVLATGALSNSETTIAAVDYAWERGMLVAAVAADENSYHHNFPAMNDHALYIHSISHNTGDDDGQVYSYFNTWNCNNFGARMDFVAASHACATGSAAVTGGVLGLLRSAALDTGQELKPGEVYQLLTQTATDIHLTEEERTIARAYPSEEGWDPFYGYGRLDVEAAVAAVYAGDIPPTADITSPRWFTTFDPVVTPSISITADISADRSSGYSWTLEYGLGNDPREWTTLSSGDGDSPLTGEIATLDLAGLPDVSVVEGDDSDTIVDRLERVNRPSVTLRLSVTDAEGRLALARKTVFSYADPDLLPGFPLALGGSGEASPVLEDLDGDGDFEIIVATGTGSVLVVQHDGTMLDGWPVFTDVIDDLAEGAPAFLDGEVPLVREAFLASPAAGDLDGDGVPEVVGATITGSVYAWHADGSLVDGFPTYAIGRLPEEMGTDFRYDQGFAGAPTLYDLDDDGSLEIVIGGADGRLYVFGADGSDWGPYPIEMCEPSLCGISGSRIVSSPSIGDVDGDGDPDIALGTNEAASNGSDSVAHLVDGRTGEALPGWPFLQAGLINTAVLLPIIGEGHPSSLSLADMDGDGDMELMNPVMLGTTSPIDFDGTEVVDFPYYESEFPSGGNSDIPSLIQLVNNSAFGDMDGDGTPDVVMGGVSSTYLASLASRTQIDYQQAVLAWSGATGEVFEGWPRQIEDVQFLSSPAIADITGDGRPEALMGSGGYLLHAWDVTGEEAAGWPKFTGHWMLASPAVGDLDGDGYLEVVITTREGWLFAWTTDGPADQDVQWQGIHHDARNTGNHSTALPAQAGPPLVEDAAGCCKGRDAKKSAWLLLPLGLIGWRRRLRRRD